MSLVPYSQASSWPPSSGAKSGQRARGKKRKIFRSALWWPGGRLEQRVERSKNSGALRVFSCSLSTNCNQSGHSLRPPASQQVCVCLVASERANRQTEALQLFACSAGRRVPNGRRPELDLVQTKLPNWLARAPLGQLSLPFQLSLSLSLFSSCSHFVGPLAKTSKSQVQAKQLLIVSPKLRQPFAGHTRQPLLAAGALGKL